MPVANALSTITGLPMPKKMGAQRKKKKKFLEETVGWLRNNDPDVDDVLDDTTVEALAKLVGQSLPPGIRRI